MVSGFGDILETPESDWLEFKSQPYQLATDAGKFEIAKDVSALANADGGYIVVGVLTKKDATRSEELAEQITPVPLELLDCDQIRQVVERYVYPTVRKLGCAAWKGANEKGLLTIHVPAQPDHEKYFIVTEGLTDDGRLRTNQIGLFIRDGATTPPVRAAYVHELIRQGKRLRSVGEPDSPDFALSLARALGIRTEGDLQPGTPHGLPHFDEEKVREEAEAAGIETGAYLYLQNRPGTRVELDDLHSRGHNTLRAQFEQPPSLRTHGFNLDFGPGMELVAGGGLRRVRSGTASISLYPDGQCTFVVGQDRLEWATSQRGEPFINSLVLVEGVAEFCRFVTERLDSRAASPSAIRAGFMNTGTRRPLLLASGMPGRPFSEPRRPAPDQQDFSVEAVRATAEEQAFELLRGLYTHFGLGPEGIPFGDRAAKRIRFEELASA